jgi:hypothetical protein
MGTVEDARELLSHVMPTELPLHNHGNYTQPMGRFEQDLVASLRAVLAEHKRVLAERDWHREQEAGLRDDIPILEAERDAVVNTLTAIRELAEGLFGATVPGAVGWESAQRPEEWEYAHSANGYWGDDGEFIAEDYYDASDDPRDAMARRIKVGPWVPVVPAITDRNAIRKDASNMRGGYQSLAANHANAAINLTREIDKREAGTL